MMFIALAIYAASCGFDGIKSLHIDMWVQMNLKRLSLSESFGFIAKEIVEKH
jgi:hypothetical protein